MDNEAIGFWFIPRHMIRGAANRQAAALDTLRLTTAVVEYVLLKRRMLNIPETVIHTSYVPWLARVDALIGKPARLDLARHTSFIAAWQEGLSPHEAVADAKIRSNAQRLPRWRMRWKQAI